MKAFEKWFDKYIKDDPERRNRFWYLLMKPFMKTVWKAALEWMLKEMTIDPFLNKKIIEKELNEDGT